MIASIMHWNHIYHWLHEGIMDPESEHYDKSIPDTDCIPVQEIEKRIGELEQYRDKKIIVYCRSGNRSGTATKILNENGFDAYNLIGGMNGWKGEVETGK